MAATALKSRIRYVRERLPSPAGTVTRALSPLWMGERPPIRTVDAEGVVTEVEAYWTRHTVDTMRAWTPAASKRQLEWRFSQYPLFREFSGLWGDHAGEVVLDYGCGPGNDVTGLALFSGAAKVIGIDVSRTALDIASNRLALHRIAPARVDLIQTPEGEPSVPLQDESVDYLQSQGVLHHTSDPKPILRELLRVLKPGGEACVMVYNRDSVWLNLYVAYQHMVVQGLYSDLPVEKAFARTTDGPDCPISRCYAGEQFASECEAAGFEARYLGGYMSKLELDLLAVDGNAAIHDDALAPAHREFLASLERDDAGYPLHRGKHAGIGGTYRLRRPA